MSEAMTPSHKVTPNLRFIKRDGRNILQQFWFPIDWNTHQEEWRDVLLVEDVTNTTGG